MAGAAIGFARYHEDAAFAAARGGARLELDRSWGILLEAATEVLALSDGLISANRIGLGTFVTF